MPAGMGHLFTMPDTLGAGVERRRCPKPGITEWAMETAGFNLWVPWVSPSSFSSSARGRWAGRKSGLAITTFPNLTVPFLLMRTARQPHAEWTSWRKQSAQSQDRFQARHFISTREVFLKKKKKSTFGFFSQLLSP